MSGECDRCDEHCLECKCPIIQERKWISKEEAKEIFHDSENLDKKIEFPKEIEEWAYCCLIHPKRPIFTGRHLWIPSIYSYEPEIIWKCDVCEPFPVSARLRRALYRNGFNSLKEITKYTENQLLNNLRGFGKHTINELKKLLLKYDLFLKKSNRKKTIIEESSN